MTVRVCTNGHRFEKKSNCLVCPICSSAEMQNKYGDTFPVIGAPAFRALASIGITALSQLTDYSEKDLLALHRFGPKALRLLRDRLAERGLHLRT